jgi:hypothetical protein
MIKNDGPIKGGSKTPPIRREDPSPTPRPSTAPQGAGGNLAALAVAGLLIAVFSFSRNTPSRV